MVRRLVPVSSSFLISDLMKPTLILLVSIAFLSAGCESTPHYDRTKVLNLLPGGPKRPHGSAKIWQAKTEVPGAYDVLAILTVSGDAGEEALFLKAFLYHADDLGGDGVLVERVNLAVGQQGGFVLGSKGGFGGTQVSQNGLYRGEVIRLKPQ